jgi:hypothetical protein
MMIRTAVSMALVALGLAGLSGCGSGHPAATLAKPGVSIRATISAPPDAVAINAFTQLFGTPLPANPAAARVMASFREAMVLWDESTGNLFLAPSVTEYVVGDARTHLNAVLATEKKDNYLPAGTDRFWNSKVTAITTDSATLATCDDGTKYVQENPNTGETLPPAPPDRQYLFETWNLVPLDGHWAITSFTLVFSPDSRAAACKLAKS